LSLQFGIHIPVIARPYLFMLSFDRANRSLFVLGYDNQTTSMTWQSAWIWGRPLVVAGLFFLLITI